MAQEHQQQQRPEGQRGGSGRDVEARRGQRGIGRQEAWLPTGQAGPFNFIRRFAEQMDQLFEDFGMPSAGPEIQLWSPREHGWTPQIEAFERKGNFVVRADLPGLKREDVQVEMTDDGLCIQGQRKQEHEDEQEGYYRSERRYGTFYRLIPLPEGVDADKTNATFRDGVLEVTMPMPEQTRRRRRIEIGEGAPGGAREGTQQGAGQTGTGGRGR